MIPAKTYYKTYNGKLLVIVEAFKTWKHYLEGYKHKVLVLTKYNNLHQFINTKNIIFCQVQWAQELSQYDFQFDYHQEKVNKATDILSCFAQRN